MLGRVSSYDQRLMWALVIVLPVNILISFVLGRMRFGVADLINRRNAQLTAAIAERANNMLLIKSMGTEEKEAVAGEARMRASYQAEVTDLWGARTGAAGQRHRRRAAKCGDHPGGPCLLQRRRPGPDPMDRLLRVLRSSSQTSSATTAIPGPISRARRGLWTACPKSWTSRKNRWTRAGMRGRSRGIFRCGTCASPTGTHRCLPASTPRSLPEKLPPSWAPPAAARRRC